MSSTATLAPPMVVRLSDLPDVARRICARLDARGAAIDHVVFIETGGRLLGLEIARQLGCGATPIYSTRRGSQVKRLLSPMFHMLPTRVAHELRRLELGSGMHNKAADRSVTLRTGVPATASAILVVDDAVDTGHSLFSVVEYLDAHGTSRDRLITAAITVTADAVFYRPDICLYSHLITFPWSPGSPDARECRQLLRDTTPIEP